MRSTFVVVVTIHLGNRDSLRKQHKIGGLLFVYSLVVITEGEIIHQERQCDAPHSQHAEQKKLRNLKRLSLQKMSTYLTDQIRPEGLEDENKKI